MEFGTLELVLLPIGLGLLGFVEPCTIGGHLLFLETQSERPQSEKVRAVMIFIAARSVVTGSFGALVAFVGQRLIDLQTAFWLIFGAIYLVIAIAAFTGRAGLLWQRIELAPGAWRHAKNPLVLGLGFGLNIPACAAPILFALLGLTATAGTGTAGFFMMFIFGLSLSLPLVVFAAVPRLASMLAALAGMMKRTNWLIGVVFAVLGLWSIWFGLYVDPATWSGK